MSRNQDEAARLASRRKGQQRALLARTCPKCKRGNALRRTDSQGWVGKSCRYCDYETGEWL